MTYRDVEIVSEQEVTDIQNEIALLLKARQVSAYKALVILENMVEKIKKQNNIEGFAYRPHTGTVN